LEDKTAELAISWFLEILGKYDSEFYSNTGLLLFMTKSTPEEIAFADVLT